jgi:phosphomannomutase
MVTASHNPPQFNGFKLIKRRGLQTYGKEIKKIRKIIKNEEFKTGKGKIIKKHPLPDYLSHILSFDNSDKLKIVVDYGNGVGSVTGKDVFKKMNLDVISLFDQVDGSFPNHLPNPTPENMKELKKRVKKEKADLGVFFDGDGDRAFFVDDGGEMLYPDILTSLIVKEELSNRKEKRVYFDLRFSKVTAEKISEAGGVPEMMQVGNPFYKEKLIQEGGLMGAELSGHIMHCDNFSIDDGLFITVKLINFLSDKKKKLSELIKPLKKYYQSEEINMSVENKSKALNKVREAFEEGISYDLDGVYIEFDKWWFNLRKSNTEDLVRLRVEADSEKLVKEKTDQIVSLIKDC